MAKNYQNISSKVMLIAGNARAGSGRLPVPRFYPGVMRRSFGLVGSLVAWLHLMVLASPVWAQDRKAVDVTKNLVEGFGDAASEIGTAIATAAMIVAFIVFMISSRLQIAWLGRVALGAFGISIASFLVVFVQSFGSG